jgi:hypothetical protein
MKQAGFSTQTSPSSRLEGGGSIDYPWWALTFWHGMGLRAWTGLLIEGQFRVSPSKLGVAVTATIFSCLNSLGRLITDRKYARRLKKCQLPDDPIFIIGHWRSGTTFLHELMILDPRYSTSSTYQCFAPGHFMTTQGFTRRSYSNWLLPSQRPGDNVKAGWKRPQEDEFALLNLGAPSPYRRIAFPHQQPTTPQALDISKLSNKERHRWQRTMKDFVLRLRLKDKRRLILKSPTHTARIAEILKIFPKAQFIHITRNPYVVFPSTRRIWQALHQTQSLQKRLPSTLDDYIFACFQEMQEAFSRDRKLLGDCQLHELRYEDLVRDPVTALRDIYSKLGLGDFSAIEEALQDRLGEIQNYRTNSYELPDQLKASIARRWRDFFETYAYSMETGEPIR